MFDRAISNPSKSQAYVANSLFADISHDFGSVGNGLRRTYREASWSIR